MSNDEDLVFKTSKWQRLLYRTEVEANDGLAKMEENGKDRAPNFSQYQREVFSRMYNPMTNKLDAPAEGSEWAQELHGLAEEVAEFKVLQERCKGDEVWSGMATATINKSVVAQMKKQPENMPDQDKIRERIESLKDLAKKGVPVGKRLVKAERDLEKAQKQAEAVASGILPEEMRNAIRKACNQAQDEISGAEQEQDAFTYGSEAGVPGHHKNIKEKRELAKRLGQSNKLKDIAKLAGRMRRIAAEKQRSKSNYARDEVSSIEQGADIERVLPSELALLGMGAEFEDMFYAKMAEKKLVQYSLKGREVVGRGPIVMCVDESGSMSGSGEVWAKSVALAMLDIAQRQKRSWYFIHFDSRVTRVDKVEAGKVEQGALFECMEYFTGGGTSFEEPLNKALECIQQDGNFKKADVVLITDGYCDTSPEFNQKFKEQIKALDVQVLTVLVNEYAAGAVTEWSTKVYKLSDVVDGSRSDDFNTAAYSV